MTTRKRVGNAKAALPDAPDATAAEGEAPPPAAPAMPHRMQAQPLIERAPVTHVAQGVAEPTTLARPEPPFFYSFHPQRWKVLGGRVVPHLNRLVAEPGVNGVGMVMHKGKRIPVVEQAKAAAKQRGELVLEWDIDGPGTSYIAQDPRTGGWFDRWTSIFPGTDVVEYDEAGFSDWVETLYARGVIPRPPLWVISRLRQGLLDIRHRLAEGHPNLGEIDRQLSALEAEQTRITAELEPVAPTPSTPSDVQ